VGEYARINTTTTKVNIDKKIIFKEREQMWFLWNNPISIRAKLIEHLAKVGMLQQARGKRQQAKENLTK
jgi:hypothetical protein